MRHVPLTGGLHARARPPRRPLPASGGGGSVVVRVEDVLHADACSHAAACAHMCVCTHVRVGRGGRGRAGALTEGRTCFRNEDVPKTDRLNIERALASMIKDESIPFPSKCPDDAN